MKTTYACLLTFTDQGVRNLAQSPKRAAAWRKQAESDGLKVTSQLWFAGAYDGLIIVEGNDETKVLRSLAGLSALGNVRTHSLRAFDAKEFSAIAGK
jgi:uncharacterized protein with GYD domain